jgi:membrane-associated protease RseP (regulator of RpoE activity)
MNYLLRPYRSFKYSVIPVLLFTAVLAGVIAVPPPKARAQSGGVITIVEGSSPLLLASSQGYLGVEIVDVDAEKAQALKLKEVRGAVITLIDHDAPAGQIGLKVNDVVLQLNGQNVEGSEQLRRMLKEIPAGRKVSIEISRDGNIQTLAVELADRQVLGHDIWNQIDNGGDAFAQPPSMGILSGGGDTPATSGGFHIPFFGSSLNVGVLVEPLTSQMADYMGVPSGLMVKQVARKSEAAVAGLRAFDIILKVGTEPVTNLAGWDRALRSNQGKPVQITIMRDKKQQMLTLQVDSKHRQGSLQMQEVFPAVDCPLMALADQELVIDPAEAIAAAETLRDQLNIQEFKIDPKQLEQFQQQMEEFRKSFNSDDFKLDQKQQDELRYQMQQWQKHLKDMKTHHFGNYV